LINSDPKLITGLNEPYWVALDVAEEHAAMFFSFRDGGFYVGEGSEALGSWSFLRATISAQRSWTRKGWPLVMSMTLWLVGDW
jgi:hypothetical protein